MYLVDHFPGEIISSWSSSERAPLSLLRSSRCHKGGKKRWVGASWDDLWWMAEPNDPWMSRSFPMKLGNHSPATVPGTGWVTGWPPAARHARAAFPLLLTLALEVDERFLGEKSTSSDGFEGRRRLACAPKAAVVLEHKHRPLASRFGGHGMGRAMYEKDLESLNMMWSQGQFSGSHVLVTVTPFPRYSSFEASVDPLDHRPHKSHNQKAGMHISRNRYPIILHYFPVFLSIPHLFPIYFPFISHLQMFFPLSCVMSPQIPVATHRRASLRDSVEAQCSAANDPKIFVRLNDIIVTIDI